MIPTIEALSGDAEKEELVTAPSGMKYYIDISLNYWAEGVERRSNKK